MRLIHRARNPGCFTSSPQATWRSDIDGPPLLHPVSEYSLWYVFISIAFLTCLACLNFSGIGKTLKSYLAVICLCYQARPAGSILGTLITIHRDGMSVRAPIVFRAALYVTSNYGQLNVCPNPLLVCSCLQNS